MSAKVTVSSNFKYTRHASYLTFHRKLMFSQIPVNVRGFNLHALQSEFLLCLCVIPISLPSLYLSVPCTFYSVPFSSFPPTSTYKPVLCGADI